MVASIKQMATIATAFALTACPALVLSACGPLVYEGEYRVSGVYASTSREGVEVFLEFEDNKMRIGSWLNVGPWRDYVRDGNELEVSGTNGDGTVSTMVIEVLSDDEIVVKDFLIDGQDVTFARER